MNQDQEKSEPEKDELLVFNSIKKQIVTELQTILNEKQIDIDNKIAHAKADMQYEINNLRSEFESILTDKKQSKETDKNPVMTAKFFSNAFEVKPEAKQSYSKTIVSRDNSRDKVNIKSKQVNLKRTSNSQSTSFINETPIDDSLLYKDNNNGKEKPKSGNDSATINPSTELNQKINQRRQSENNTPNKNVNINLNNSSNNIQSTVNSTPNNHGTLNKVSNNNQSFTDTKSDQTKIPLQKSQNSLNLNPKFKSSEFYLDDIKKKPNSENQLKDHHRSQSASSLNGSFSKSQTEQVMKQTPDAVLQHSYSTNSYNRVSLKNKIIWMQWGDVKFHTYDTKNNKFESVHVQTSDKFNQFSSVVMDKEKEEIFILGGTTDSKGSIDTNRFKSYNGLFLTNLKEYPVKICQNNLFFVNSKIMHTIAQHSFIKKNQIHNIGSKGLILASGGKSEGKVTNECQVFDIKVNQWFPFPDLTYARECHTVFYDHKHNRFFAAGGCNNQSTLDNIEMLEFNVSLKKESSANSNSNSNVSSKWVLIDVTLPIPLYSFQSFQFKTELIIIGGKTQDRHKNGLIWKFDGKSEFKEMFDVGSVCDSIKETVETDATETVWQLSLWKTSKRRKILKIDTSAGEVSEVGCYPETSEVAVGEGKQRIENRRDI